MHYKFALLAIYCVFISGIIYLWEGENSPMKGFTLIEIIIAMFIFSLSLSAGLMSISKMRTAKVEVIAESIARELDYQALRAGLMKKEQRITFESDSLVGEDGKVLLSLPKTIGFQDAAFGNLSKDRNVLVLRTNGSATPGRVVLVDAEKTCSIIQSLYGTRRILCK